MFVCATHFQRRSSLLVLALLLGFGGGCDFPNRSGQSEETDPHYLDGMTAKKLYDWDAAIAHFENALHANPSSGAAHRELGFLFDEKKTNFIRALYHYQQFKELHSSETNRLVEDRVFYCRVKLASEYTSYLDRVQNQTEIDRWRAAVGQRDQEIANLRAWIAQISQLTNRIGDASSGLTATSAPSDVVSNDTLVIPASNQLTPATSPQRKAIPPAALRTPESPPRTPPPPARTAPTLDRSPPPPIPTKFTAPVGAKRRHAIRSGDTLARIAKQYGVSLARLQSANPGLDPHKLKVGRWVVIPDSFN